MFVGLLSVCPIVAFCESLASNEKVRLNKHPFQTRPTIFHVNSDETLFYQFNVSVYKCVGSCNTIDDTHVRVYVPNKVKNMNVKVFHLISGINQARFIVQHELCECKCGLNESVCDSKQKWNQDKCWYERKN